MSHHIKHLFNVLQRSSKREKSETFDKKPNKLRKSRKPGGSKALDKMPSGVGRDPNDPPEGLGQMIADYIQSMTQVRVAAELCDYAWWAHKELQMEDLESLLWTHPPPPTPDLDWVTIERQLAQEERQLKRYRLLLRNPQPHNEDVEKPVKPKIPWFCEYADALVLLGKTDDLDISNQIKAYARGKEVFRGSIYQKIFDCDFRELAQRFAEATANLDSFFRDRGDAEGEMAIRCILERIQGRFFTHCSLQQGKLD
ncbi:MAG: hypothetical protein Q9221_006483 [Calogaya cf. arnoldii]